VQSLSGSTRQKNEELNDAVVFHAQQCVEKLLKARLIQLDQPIQKVHDLVAISRHLASVDADWHWDEEDLSDLSTGAVLARYPGFETTADVAAQLISLSYLSSRVLCSSSMGSTRPAWKSLMALLAIVPAGSAKQGIGRSSALLIPFARSGSPPTRSALPFWQLASSVSLLVSGHRDVSAPALGCLKWCTQQSTNLGDHPERTYGGIELAGGHGLVDQFV